MPAALTTRPDERSLFDAPQIAPQPDAPRSGAPHAPAREPVSGGAPLSLESGDPTGPVDQADPVAQANAGPNSVGSSSQPAEHVDHSEPVPSPSLSHGVHSPNRDPADLDPTDIEPPAARPTTTAPAPTRRGPLIDAGWLFLISGVALISFTVIIPAYNDLQDARFYRERMRLAEDHRELRLSRYQEYQSALNRADDTLVRSLAAMQLNQAPADQELIKSEGDIATRTASPFGSLEPPPLVLPDKVVPPKSTLEKWATDDRSRLWLLAAGALLILVGMLPAARRS
jgi:hypothetical protein